MSGHLVSIIVPTFNRADCLEETLGTVLSQTHADWELVLVDDGSTDNTRELVCGLFHGDSRLKYLYQPNAGVSHARNTGLANATGDFVAFLDSDDRWMPWKLEAQLACMDAYPDVGMVWTDMEAIDDKSVRFALRYLRTMYSAYHYHELDTLFSASAPAAQIPGLAHTLGTSPEEARFYRGDIFSSMIMGSLVHTSTVMLRRERALAVGGFDESLKHSGEDYDFHLRTCREGPVGLLDVPSIQYRIGRPDRLTQHTDAIAVNFLFTVQKAIAADAGKRLPRKNVKRVLTEAHAWIAEEKFKLNDRPAVRRHAWQSLRRSPYQPRLIGLALLAFVPPSLLSRSLRAYRITKQRSRGPQKIG